MGRYDWSAICSVECIQYDGYKDTLRVRCYWKCNGWRYNMRPVYGYVYRAGEGEICVANGISVNFQNNQGQYELGYHDYVINRGQSNIHSTFGAHIHSAASYASGDKWSGEVGYDTGALASYTITYNANGGSGAPGNQTRWYGSNINLSGTRPTRTGYTFLGWATSPSGGVAYQPGQSFGGDYNLNLYAVWQVNTWTVSYNANGGVNAPASQIKTYGQTLVLSKTVPTKIDYNFLGWATSKTDADAGKVTYAAGANYTSNANITLYAVWELAYVRPRITNLSITRCDSAGNNNESGTYLRIDFNWATDMTAAVAKLQYKLQTASAWTEETIFTGNDNKSGTVTKKVLASNKISTESSYIARIYMYDSKGASDTNYRSYSSEFSIGTLAFPIDIRKGGKGIAFGKVAESDNLADYNFDVQFRKNFKLKTPGGIKNFLDAVYPVGSIYMSVKSTNPGTLFGGTWVAIAGKFLIGVGTHTDINGDKRTLSAGQTGGTYAHILTYDELPKQSFKMPHIAYYNNCGNSEGWSDASRLANNRYEGSATQNDANAGWHIMRIGNNKAHTNIPPYIAVYMWQRTA
nr:MAG TPA: tail protein [Caudoviricetes sp.]